MDKIRKLASVGRSVPKKFVGKFLPLWPEICQNCLILILFKFLRDCENSDIRMHKICTIIVILVKFFHFQRFVRRNFWNQPFAWSTLSLKRHRDPINLSRPCTEALAQICQVN